MREVQKGKPTNYWMVGKLELFCIIPSEGGAERKANYWMVGKLEHFCIIISSVLHCPSSVLGSNPRRSVC